MALKTTVKVSHISGLSDARYCAGMGVGLLGFGVLPDQEQYVTPEVFQDIRGWISGPQIVAEIYGLRNTDDLGAIIRTYAPDYFELSLAEYQRLGDALELPCIVRLPGPAPGPSVAGGGKVMFLLAGESATCQDIAGTGFPALKEISSVRSLEEWLTQGCFAGVELKAPKASQPGITSYDHLGEILEALEENGV